MDFKYEPIIDWMVDTADKYHTELTAGESIDYYYATKHYDLSVRVGLIYNAISLEVRKEYTLEYKYKGLVYKIEADTDNKVKDELLEAIQSNSLSKIYRTK